MVDEYQCPGDERLIYRFTREEKGQALRRCWSSAYPRCAMKSQCTTSDCRRITRWEHEAVVDAAERRLDLNPDSMRIRRSTVEHPYGTLKTWMGYTHFLTKTLPLVSTEMSLNVLAYNMKRVVAIMSTKSLIAAIQM